MGHEVDHIRPEGGTVVLVQLDSQRPVDLMAASGVLSEDQALACRKWRDNWELGARLVADARAGGQRAGHGEMSDEAAERWIVHTAVLRALGPARGMVASKVILHDEPLDGRFLVFGTALEILVRMAASGALP